MKRYLAQIALVAAIALALVASLFSDRLDLYSLDIAIAVGINITLAVSLNLVNGHTGQFSLGHAGFMAVGAYGSALVTLELGPRLAAILGSGVFGTGLVFLLALLAGGICAAICGWLVGVPSLRLRGDYLAIVTLGFNEIIRVILQRTKADGPFGGALGLKGIPENTSLFWAFAIAAVTIYVTSCMVNSTYGRGFLAVRDDEVAGESMGINTVRYKVTAFVVGAFFAGLGGGLFAHQKTTISPAGFDFMKSVDIVIMVILGGMGSTPGVVLAAIGLTVLNEHLRDYEQNRMIIFSLLLIVMMIVRPQGLLPPTLFQNRRKSA
ncbi:MAG: branched-chain amino acid ABC transporter permease [Verrucomicrobiales bacterium]|nr:branched-chain amino acid ABC transporter permease [Verrucomicrobiales bacterium]